MPSAFSSLVRWSLCVMGTVSFLVSIFMLNALEKHSVELPIQQHRLASKHHASMNATTTNTSHFEEWPLPFIHVINTRFMQHQADLVDLARARLVLFETFCLNSILQQSILTRTPHTPFLWIIKTDPDLDESLIQELVSLIKPYPFIYLVASNVNYGIGIHPGGWRGGEAGEDILQSQVWSGNMTLLQHAHAARNTRAILETRLDADDGLHVHFLQTIQAEAYTRLRYTTRKQLRSRQKWMYWCSLNHLDWSPTLATTNNNSTDEYGTFVPYKTAKACITAGITLGVSVNQKEESIPRFMHHQLYHELIGKKEHATTCGTTTCLHMLDKPVLGAIRSRTATSAGMRNVNMIADDDTRKHAVPIDNSHLLHALEQAFHVSVSSMIHVNRYMQDHVYEIAADNLKGQCTHGHSCKNSTREALQDLLRVAKNSSSVYYR